MTETDTSLFAGTLRGFRHWGLNMTVTRFYNLSIQEPEQKPNVWGLDLESPGYGHTPHVGVNEAKCNILKKYEESHEEDCEYSRGESLLLHDIRNLTADLARYDPEAPDHTAAPTIKTGYFGLPSAGYLKRRLALLTAYANGEPHPFKNCQCGFYASYTPDENFYFPKGRNYGFGQYMHAQKLGGVTPIQGVVECHGRIVLGTKGFRASRMEIKALCIDKQFRPHGQIWDADLQEALAYMIVSRHPEARWYGTDWQAMHEDWPAPDTSGLPVHIDRDYAV